MVNLESSLLSPRIISPGLGEICEVFISAGTPWQVGVPILHNSKHCSIHSPAALQALCRVVDPPALLAVSVPPWYRIQESCFRARVATIANQPVHSCFCQKKNKTI